MSNNVKTVGRLQLCGLLAVTALLGGCAASSGNVPDPASTSGITPDSRVLLVGDQGTGGTSCGGAGTKNWSRIVSDELESRSVTIETSSVQDAGYVAPAANGVRLSDLADAEITSDTTEVYVFGGGADATHIAELDGAADTTIKAIRAAAPDATLVMVGPLSPVGANDLTLATVNDILRRVAERNGASFMTALNWSQDTPNLFCPNTTELTDRGQELLGANLAETVKRFAG